MRREALWRILPFAVFMAFIGFIEVSTRLGAGPDQKTVYLLYPVRIAVAGLLLLIFRKRYAEIDWGDIRRRPVASALSALCGIVVFILWINMDWRGPFPAGGGAFDPAVFGNGVERAGIMAARLFGAAAVVPVMEEIFWRSFILRYIIDPDFTRVSIGRFTWGSFAVCAVLFGIEHDMILAGVMAGAAYNLLLYRTKSVSPCILAHGVTNLALGVYVIQTGSWRFW